MLSDPSKLYWLADEQLPGALFCCYSLHRVEGRLCQPVKMLRGIVRVRFAALLSILCFWK